MNVGLVLPGFSASEEDWCIPALLSFVRRLVEHHDVRVLALRYPCRRSRYVVSGASVEALGGARARGLARLPLLMRGFAALLREHRRKPFDVIHGLWADEPGWLSATAARRLGVPSVVTPLGGELVALPEIGYGGRLSRLNRYLVSRSLESASRVTVGSRSLATLAAPYQVAVDLLPIGVDHVRFQPGPSRSALLAGEPRLLHVASLVPVKGQRDLLRAFAKVRQSVPGAGLNIVGDGPLRDPLARLAAELGVSQQLRFHGHVPHEALPDYYRAADLCVLASLHEGQEWVTQEAAACGRTSVGTRVGVIPDLEPATRAVQIGDCDALAHAMVDLLGNRDGLRARGEAAHREIVDRYALDTTVERLGHLYARLTCKPVAENESRAPRSART